MKFWRWNLHAAIATLAVSPLMLGWAWGLPLLSHPDGLFHGGAAREQTAYAAGATPRPAADLIADTRPLAARVTTYRVESGDTLAALATRFGISAETLRWANNLPDTATLVVGRELTVLPVSGVLHPVVEGDTVANLAERYGVTTARLIEANGLEEPFGLAAGQRLLVPGAQPLPPTPATRTAEWPAPGTGDQHKQQFIEAAAPFAQDSQRRLGIPTSVIIAQAIHESYWGTSKLARNANNFFGIKSRNGEGSAGTYWMDAWEVINGEDVVTPEPFRAYNNPGESFYDHGMFFLRNSRYYGAFKYGENPRQFAQAIADAGYATDPDYAPKLIRIMDQFDLYQYDLH
ncbi:MAG TPA: glucosaminidase domain-containing protein [Chloroflexota bacterium]